MSGIEITDTYGPLFGADQMCDCTFTGQVRVGDRVCLDTDAEPLEFRVTLIEFSLDKDGHKSDIVGLGLEGSDSDLVMPGDTLTHSYSRPGTAATTFTCIAVEGDQHVEITQSLFEIDEDRALVTQ